MPQFRGAHVWDGAGTLALEIFSRYNTQGRITVLHRYVIPARLIRFLLSTSASFRTSCSVVSNMPLMSPSPF
jgi:hypothetical protein